MTVIQWALELCLTPGRAQWKHHSWRVSSPYLALLSAHPNTFTLFIFSHQSLLQDSFTSCAWFIHFFYTYTPLSFLLLLFFLFYPILQPWLYLCSFLVLSLFFLFYQGVNILVIFFPFLTSFLFLNDTPVSPSGSARLSSSSLALSPFFSLFSLQKLHHFGVSAVRSHSHTVFCFNSVFMLSAHSPLSFPFHLASYILFPYRPSRLPWLFPPMVTVR